jgi:hypothetical protein
LEAFTTSVHAIYATCGRFNLPARDVWFATHEEIANYLMNTMLAFTVIAPVSIHLSGIAKVGKEWRDVFAPHEI